MFWIFHPCINDTKTIQIKEFKSSISNVEVVFISQRKNKKKLYLKISLNYSWELALLIVKQKKLSFMYIKLTELNLTTLIYLVMRKTCER